ncbi:MAG: CHAP domain-containing protein, partial [Bacillota bacterium]
MKKRLMIMLLATMMTTGTAFAETTETPTVGATLGTIYDGNGSMTEPYKINNIGQCTGYAKARFLEYHGVALPYFGNAKYWVANHKNSADVKIENEISVGAIAIFEPTAEFSTMAGHVEFIEYLERDENGDVTAVYFSDSNGANDIQKGVWNDGVDGVVKKVTLAEFENQYGLKLLGYMVIDTTEKKENVTTVTPSQIPTTTAPTTTAPTTTAPTTTAPT